MKNRQVSISPDRVAGRARALAEQREAGPGAAARSSIIASNRCVLPTLYCEIAKVAGAG
jgi:hypothetical protein